MFKNFKKMEVKNSIEELEDEVEEIANKTVSKKLENRREKEIRRLEQKDSW